GSLPDYSRYGSPDLSPGRYGNVFSDSVDTIRTTLLFMSRMEGVRAVLVTSAVAGEGKTSAASHLAMSLARAGRKTLLVDGDLRRPVVHTLFGIGQGPGLSEVLRGETDIASAIRPTSFEALSVLPAGQANSQALTILSGETPGKLFKEFKGQFDFIIVDSSPVLPVPDALVMAQHADAVVFSLLRDVSRLPKVQAAYERVSNLRIRILGAIFNGSKQEAYASSIETVAS